jgi:hypothetical protein
MKWREMSFLLLCTCIVVLCTTNVFVESQNSPRSSDISITNLGVKNYLGPTLKFLYWWVQLRYNSN